MSIATPERAAAAGPLAPFRQKIFLAVWTASLASNFGSLIQGVGASWLMTSIAPSADMVALVQASTALPIMLFSLVAGAVADVFDRRIVMLAAQVLMLAVSALLYAVTAYGLISPWLLLTLTFLLGCGAALYGPAWQSSVGDLVPRSDLPQAVALNSLGFNIARTVGPAIGGFVVAAAGPEAAFLLNACTYVGLIVVLAAWRRPGADTSLPRESVGAAMLAGVRYTALSPGIRVVLGRSLAFGLFASAIWALMPLIARDRIGGGPLTYGLLLGAFGAGAVISALFSHAIRTRFRTETVVAGATLGYAAASLIAALSASLPITMAGLLAGGAGWVLALSTFNVSVQLSTPRWVVGRAMAIYQTVTFGAMAVGSWAFGLLAHAEGLSTALAAAGVGLAVSAALGRLLPLDRNAAGNMEPHRDWPEPTVRLDLRPTSGPVVVTVEYRVDPADEAAFVTAMREVRRIRRRDGGHRWTLLRDVAEPQVWIERFQTATWVDHLRQHRRSTVADLDAETRARAYHRGPEPPRVRHFLERPTAGLEPQPDVHPPRQAPMGVTIDPRLPPTRMGADVDGVSPSGRPSRAG
ncbi:MFS transporter [Chthonobacter rhizosphaerae]|uniref:MFS transporter n=1 Tax=Chthonobacter rhizosphaerae TaxID=2735553 RepID=UPI0015EF4C94|nr:MFS transporter [Chthonobacter rhizosphaerae]